MEKVNQMPPVKGFLHWVGEVKSGTTRSGDDFKAVDFVVTWKEGTYDRFGVFSLFSVDMVTRLKKLPLGSEIEVYWSLDGQEWNGRWYGRNRAIGFKTISKSTPQPAHVEVQSRPEDDLPF